MILGVPILKHFRVDIRGHCKDGKPVVLAE